MSFKLPSWFKPLRTAALLCMAGFVVALLAPAEYMFLIVRVCGFAVACGIVAAYMPTAARLWCKPDALCSGEGLVLGIWMMWFGVMGHAGINILAQHHIAPSLIVHSDAAAFFAWVSVVGGAMTLGASQGVDGSTVLTLAERTFGGIIVAVVIIVCVSLLVAQPHAWWHHLGEG